MRYTEDDFREDAMYELMKWSECADTSMDLSERHHNRMRTELLSKGQSKGAEGAIDNNFCRQMASEHANLGGDPIGQSVPLESVRRLGVGCPVLMDRTSDLDTPAGEAPAEQVGPGASVQPQLAGEGSRRDGRASGFVKLYNLKLKAAKQMLPRGATLTQDQKDRVTQSARKEWDQAKKSEHGSNPYDRMADVDRIKKAASTTNVQVGSETKQPFVGLWGSSYDRAHLFHPKEVAEHNKSGERHRKKKTEARLKSMPVENRMAKCLAQRHLLDGCHCNKKNACRLHALCPAVVCKLDIMTYKLTKYVETIDKQILMDRMGFCLFQDDKWHAMAEALPCGPMPVCRDTIVCVQDTVGSPKVQYLLRHVLGKDQSGPLHFVCPELPFLISAHAGTSRLSDKVIAFDTWTSDELVVALLQHSPDWSIRGVTCRLTDANPDLRVVVVLSIGEAFTLPKKVRVNKYYIEDSLWHA